MCPHPEIDLTTNGGMVEAVQDYQQALDDCNAMHDAVDDEINFPKIGTFEFTLPDLDWINPFKGEDKSNIDILE